jgi:hypothetical protein
MSNKQTKYKPVMEKEFIPYEQALALKELGFDEPCFGIYYTKDGDIRKLDINEIGDAPLYQQAFRWFRDKYNLNGILNHYPNTKLWDFSVHDLRWSGKEFIEHVKKEDRSVKYSTYEEAELGCLKQLIKIIKTK